MIQEKGKIEKTGKDGDNGKRPLLTVQWSESNTVIYASYDRRICQLWKFSHETFCGSAFDLTTMV